MTAGTKKHCFANDLDSEEQFVHADATMAKSPNLAGITNIIIPQKDTNTEAIISTITAPIEYMSFFPRMSAIITRAYPKIAGI